MMSQTDLDERRHAALELLRPLCIVLMQDISRKNVRTLISSLHHVDASITQEIQQYILFPIQNALRQKSLSESVLADLCEAISVVLSKTNLTAVQIFLDLLNPLLISFTSQDGSNAVRGMSEDTKTAWVKAILALLKSSTETVLENFYTLQWLPAIGQLISVLLSLSEFEKSRGLQIAALDCLLVLLQTGTKFGKKNEFELAELFAFCVPGVTMATCRVITGDSKQGHSVLSKAMNVWARIVTLVISDKSLSQVHAPTAPQKSKVKVDELLHKLQALAVKRDESWVKATAVKLDVLIGQICKLTSHSNWRVRLSLADMTEEVLMSCSKSLAESVPKLLEVLVGLINDEYGNVAKKAQAALQTFSTSQSGTAGERTLIQILEENLHGLASSLPRQLKMCDEEDKPALISLLHGYISMLGPNINCVLNSSPHLQRLTLALVQALEMEVSDSAVLEERGSLLNQEPQVFTDTSALTVWRPRKYFKHFRDDAVLTGLMCVCRQLGKFGNIYILVDHLLELYQESALYRLAAILIINEVVVGAGCLGEDGSGDAGMRKDLELLNDVIRMLLDEYLSSTNLKLVDSFDDRSSPSHLPVASSSSSSSSSPAYSSFSSSLVVVKTSESPGSGRNLVNRNRAILLVCLFMEGVAKFASVLRKQFQTHLIDALYPLLENLGHENLHISSVAYSALVEVAVACNYRSLDSLIRDNADYLVSSVSLRLRHFDKNRRSPRTVCVMLRYCSSDLLLLIDHSVTQLLDSLDENYVEDLVLFMPVLLELTTAIGRWFPSNRPSKKEESSEQQSSEKSNANPSSQSASLNGQDVIQTIKEYVRNKQITEGNFTDEAFSTDDETEPARDCGDRTLEDIDADIKKLTEDQRKEREKEEEEKDVDENDDDKKEPPKHIQVLREICQRLKNLLSSHDPRLQVQALDVVSQACLNMRDQERELLPQIHQLWPSFHPMFHSEEKFVVIKALKVLVVMSEVSGDFIRQRVMKDVFPGLVSYMDKQAKISSGSRPTYLHTTHFKLQLSVLSTLGLLATHLGLDSNHLNQVAQSCIPYLSELQPVELQKACTVAFSAFISLDADAMWLLLNQKYSPLELNPPGQDFVPVKFSCGQDSKNNFTANITELFRLFYS